MAWSRSYTQVIYCLFFSFDLVGAFETQRLIRYLGNNTAAPNKNGAAVCGLTRWFVHRKGPDHLLDDRVALGANLLVGGILDGMRHKDPRRLGQAERG
jgi:hypothetical protein